MPDVIQRAELWLHEENVDECSGFGHVSGRFHAHGSDPPCRGAERITREIQLETQDIRTLKILEQIDRERAPSQRDLARDLNISLGLVNSFFKRLVHKGYLKATTIPRNRLRYIITPKGMLEKSRLTYSYIQFSYQYYRQARQNLQALFCKLEAAGVRRVVFYGATDIAEIASLALQETSIELAAVVDDRHAGQRKLRRVVTDSQSLTGIAFDRIVVTDDGQRERSIEMILSAGVSRSRIVFFE
jgi:DNA-binding MarR family transcriptional regulator